MPLAHQHSIFHDPRLSSRRTVAFFSSNFRMSRDKRMWAASPHITSQTNAVSILRNVNVLRHEDIGDPAATGMNLTRTMHEKESREPWVHPRRNKAEVPLRAVTMEAYMGNKYPWRWCLESWGCYHDDWSSSVLRVSSRGQWLIP